MLLHFGFELFQIRNAFLEIIQVLLGFFVLFLQIGILNQQLIEAKPSLKQDILRLLLFLFKFSNFCKQLLNLSLAAFILDS